MITLSLIDADCCHAYCNVIFDFMLSVIMLSVIMLSVIMLSVILLSFIMLYVTLLNVVMRTVVAPAMAHAEGLSDRKKIAQDLQNAL